MGVNRRTAQQCVIGKRCTSHQGFPAENYEASRREHPPLLPDLAKRGHGFQEHGHLGVLRALEPLGRGGAVVQAKLSWTGATGASGPNLPLPWKR